MMYIVSVIVRLFWSLTVGWIFFFLGLILFLMFEIFDPKSDKGYKWLVKMFKYGTLHWFKGIEFKVVASVGDYEVDVKKRSIVEENDEFAEQ